mgnify:CR=1 FL=1
MFLWSLSFLYHFNRLFWYFQTTFHMLKSKKFFLCLFKLTSQSSYCLFIAFMCFLKFHLSQSQFFHCLFSLRLILRQSAFGSSQIWFQAFVNNLKFNNFFFKLYKFLFELIPFSLSKVHFSFNSTFEALRFFLCEHWVVLFVLEFTLTSASFFFLPAVTRPPNHLLSSLFVLQVHYTVP